MDLCSDRLTDGPCCASLFRCCFCKPRLREAHLRRSCGKLGKDASRRLSHELLRPFVECVEQDLVCHHTATHPDALDEALGLVYHHSDEPRDFDERIICLALVRGISEPCERGSLRAGDVRHQVSHVFF